MPSEYLPHRASLNTPDSPRRWQVAYATFRWGHLPCCQRAFAPAKECDRVSQRTSHPFAACGTPVPVLAPDSLLGEQVAETQVASQFEQRHQMPCVGTPTAFSPAPYGAGIGPQATGQLSPRQVRLLHEPFHPLRKGVGEVVCFSSVVCALSRHGAVLPQDSSGPSPKGVPRATRANCASPGLSLVLSMYAGLFLLPSFRPGAFECDTGDGVHTSPTTHRQRYLCDSPLALPTQRETTRE